jgi:hypothetical protein
MNITARRYGGPFCFDLEHRPQVVHEMRDHKPLKPNDLSEQENGISFAVNGVIAKAKSISNKGEKLIW